MEQITKELLSLPPESKILLIEALAISLKSQLENTPTDELSTNYQTPLFGSDRGKVIIGDDFEAPLEEFNDYI